ncbi:hypothetical protein GH714_012096 [Hevea brasiliensis]|uniref:Bulb-type lectin domain-containing protein n=1 Tax=Hevea brasiliensis TaxID=3981 RepID=A0A6A6LSD2_HEVBR|nr:hypothetical protein GH714_012096 [Hevea brasiliensis]
MKMMETGNLLLHDGFNNTVWQSFDHPTDKLLPGQKLLAGQKLVASISKTNVSEGDYSVSLTSKGHLRLYDHNSKSADMLRDYVNECDYPTSCGNYGLCSNGRSRPEECMHLLPIFMQKAKQNQLIDMVDRSNEVMQLCKSEVVEMMKVAIWCLQSNYTRRPSMSKVVKVLEGNMDVEADLDYSIHNATTTAAIRKAAEQATTAPLSPFILSGPR